MCCF